MTDQRVKKIRDLIKIWNEDIDNLKKKKRAINDQFLTVQVLLHSLCKLDTAVLTVFSDIVIV